LIRLTVQEVREIRERKSLEWAGLTLEQLNAEINKGANQLLAKIEKKKQSKIDIKNTFK